MKVLNYVTGMIQTNTYLCYDEDTKDSFIVDPGAYEARLTAKARELDLKVEYIILTHGHADHIGGIERFKIDFPGIKVVANINEDMLLDADLNESTDLFRKPMVVNVDRWTDDFDRMKIGNMDLLFIHTPGHTKGGQSILVDDVLFSGDTLFRYSVGRTDFYGGSFPQLIKSLREKLFTLPDETKVLPGHMDPTTIGEEKKGNPFV